MQLLFKCTPNLLFISFITILFSSTSNYAQQNQQLTAYSPDEQRSTSVQKIIIDADYTLEEMFGDVNIPSSIKNSLDLVTVNYYGFDGKLHQGQIIVNKSVVADIVKIFKVIEEIKFPVEKVVPIVHYNWSDEKSMNDNNTSSFNYRFISGSRILSMHANGLAIDINPKQNPADRRWFSQIIDLSDYAGQTLTITFETDSGQMGDNRYDWAGWGSPRLIRP